MTNQAAYAILTKSRAKYGKRLTPSNYRELLSCGSVAEVASYLKSHTHFSSALEGIQESAVHRGNLEAHLKGKIFADFAELCRFERSIGEHYFEYLLLRGEVDELLNFLRYFNAGKASEYLFALPGFFNKHTSLNLIGLSQAKTFHQVVDVLKDTPYSRILAPFEPLDGQALEFADIEAALDRYLISRSMEIMRINFIGKTRDKLLGLIAFKAELDNIRRIYRAKLYYNVPVDAIRAQLINIRHYLKKAELEELLTSSDAPQMQKRLAGTRYGRLEKGMNYETIDETAVRLQFNYCRSLMRTSGEPAVVMAATVVLFEVEVENVTNIIEGIRYHVSSDEIRKLLVAASE